MANPFDQFDAPVAANPFDKFDTPEAKPAGVIRKLGDLALSGAKGVIGLPEGAVGLADIATGGRAGKFLENEGGSFGFRPKQAKEVLTGWQSDDLKAKEKSFQDADGIVDKIGVAVSNPSLIASAAAESIPMMLGGAGVARGLMAAAPRLGALGAGALGEGVVGAGSAAESIRQETADGLLTGKQAGLAAVSGAATSAFGVAGGKAAKALGIGDVDTLLAKGSRDVLAGTEKQAQKGVVRRAGEGFASEGLLEELPQSLSEQALQNIALDKPLTEGLADAGVMGALTGGVMGAAAGVATRQNAPPLAALPAPEVAPASADPLGLPPPAITVDPSGQAMTTDQRQSLRDTSSATDVIPREMAPAPTAAQAMGIDETAGPLSKGASIAVNSGLTDALTAQAETAAASMQSAGKPLPEAMQDRGLANSAPGAELETQAAIENVAQSPQKTGAFANEDEARGYISDQKRAGGMRIQALPLPQPDGSFGVAIAGSPDYTVAEFHQKQGQLRAAGVLDGDTLTKAGGIFPNRMGAANAARKAGAGFETVPVTGGFVVRKTEASNGASAEVQSLPAGTAGRGLPDSAPSVATGVGTGPTEAPAVDAERSADQPTGNAVPRSTIAADAVTTAEQKTSVVPDTRAQSAIETVAKPSVPPPSLEPTSVQKATPPQAKPTPEAAPVEAPAPGSEPESNRVAAGAVPGTAAVEAAGLKDQPTNQPQEQPSAQTPQAIEATPQRQEPASSEVKPRPATWRTNMIAASKVARDMGIKPAGMKLAGLVEAIDAADKAQPPATPAKDGPVQVGRNNTPISEGGKPFKTKLAATTAKKLQPVMRVVRVEGGYALAEKTPAQLAAEVKAARRLRNPQTSPAGEAIPAHAMIASAGGLAPAERADMGMEGNVRVGSGWLFAGAGKGISMERATEKLIEDGYLPDDASHQQARDLIKRSLNNPQYTPEGTERMAEKEAVQREADYNAEQEAISQVEALSDSETQAIDDADIPWDAPSNVSTESAMRAMGFSEEEIQDEIARESRVAQADSASRGSADEGATTAPTQGVGSGEGAPGAVQGQDAGLVAPSRDDILAQQARKAAAEKAEAKAKADADKKEKADREAADIKAAGATAADRFVLGGNAEDELSGQGGMFDAPVKPENASTYINGDRAEYTGKTENVAGGLFYEVRFTEGAKEGKTGVTQRAPDGTNPGENKQEKPAGIVTPQLSSNPEQFVKIAADSIGQLRKTDVERVLTETPKPFRAEVAQFIKDKRKDLAQEVDDVVAEQAAESTDEPLPAITEAQARKQMEWRNLGQTDGVKTHALFFFETPADKGTGRAMRRNEVSLYNGSNGWQINGEGEKYPALADAKKAAIDAAIIGLKENGYVSKETAPVASQAATTAAKQPSADELRAKADLNNALADLGEILSKPFKANITPEQEQKLLPVLTRVLDAAFRLGYAKFKDAAKFALDQIKNALGTDVADALTLDQLQGAYIAMAGGKPGTDTKRAVIDVENKSDIESHTAKTESESEAAKPMAPADLGRAAFAAGIKSVPALDPAMRVALKGLSTKDTIKALTEWSQGWHAANIAAPIENEDNTGKGNPNAASTDGSVERNSAKPAAESAVGDAVPTDTGATAGANGQDGGPADRGARSGQQDGTGVPFGSAPVARERGDQPVSPGNPTPEFAGIIAGNTDAERGSDSGIEGVPPESIAANEVVAAADQNPTGLKASIARAQADKTPIKLGDIENIRATLPQLLPGQDTDVLAAEKRFADPKGYGMLFTNGTGTGKTFSGLGIIKRFDRQGKSATLVVVPDDKIAADWMESGRVLGLNISKLDDTKDAGKGIVITTYANLGENDALASRQWDLVVADEAHSLMQSADGEVTTYLRNVRAITYHPDGASTRHAMLNRSEIERVAELRARLSEINQQLKQPAKSPQAAVAEDGLYEENSKLNAELKALEIKLAESMGVMKQEVKDRQGAARTRMVALSATPFAYEKTIDWANGYLFEYKDGYPFNENSTVYNQPSPREYYFQTRFGYSMRTNKLNRPGAGVDSGLMQRMWNGEIKKSGALSGRMLDVVPDYDRRFVLVQSAIGNRIDEALAWLNEKRQNAAKDDAGFGNLAGVINKKFEYLEKRYLLEAIKATEVVPIVKAHMAMGRKVVVFHDYKKGGGFNPFKVSAAGASADPTIAGTSAQFNAALAQFNTQFADLVNHPFEKMGSPIDVFSRELPGVLLVNGDEKKADLLKRYKQFQDDSTGPLVMLVQSAKNKGWSGHDTTGKNQRVLINLGQPTAPTLAIQQEGRIYRTGQASDAIMRYLNTGTNWERWTFASTIASRASTAENLGMGEAARALKDSFIQSFEESDTYAPGHEDEGKGGKELDKAANNALSEYDRAKTLYFANQKKNARTKAQEGKDYFATPEPVGLKMVEWLDARSGEDLLEPSGGHGAIARWFPEKTKKTVIEPSLALRSRLALAMNAAEDRIIDGTFEEHAVVNKYDGIAMNPPFGTAGRTAVDHIAKAATHLREGGRIVALLPVGSADAKFDKWLYEKAERPVKPLATLTVNGKATPIYKGDTIVSSATWAPSGIVVSAKAALGLLEPDIMVKATAPEFRGEQTRMSGAQIKSVGATGKRTEEYSPAADLHLVASIKLPTSTFERAGTGVMTRIVVLEKNSDSAFAPARGVKDMDLTSIESTKELFDRLENITLPKRSNVQAAESEAAKVTEDKPKPAKAEKPAPAIAELGASVMLDGKPYTVEIYKTNAGKELRGVWVETQAQALKHGPSTFQKRPLGWFVRERDFPKTTAVQSGQPLQAVSMDTAAFEKAFAPAAPMTVEAAQAVVDRVAAKWSNGPRIVTVGTTADLPASLKISGNPRGVYTRDAIYIIAANNRSADQVAQTLAHEAIAHHGLRGLLGPLGHLQLMKQVAAGIARGDPALVASSRYVDSAYANQNLSAKNRADEVAAHVVEMAVDPVTGEFKPGYGFLKMTFARIAAFLRRIGIDVPFTVSELHGMLVASMRNLETGRRTYGGGVGVVAAARDGEALSAADTNPDILMATEAPDRATAIGDAIKSITVTDLKKQGGNWLANYRNLFVQTLGGRQIDDLYNKDIPQLSGYTRMVQQMSADANEVGANADEIATSWGKLKDERQLAELMHDATLAQIDPAKPFVQGDNRIQWGKLNAQFKALTAEAQKVYTDARDGYEEHYANIRDAIREKIQRSDMAKPAKAAMLERMDGEFFDKIKGVYFPLSRFGQYVVVTRDKGGQAVNVSRAETLNEADTLRAQMRKDFPASAGFAVGKVLKDKEFNAARDSVGRGFLKDLFGVLDKEGVGEELQDAVNQLYLASMPDLSWAKHGIHRKGTPGFSQDARRAYAQNMFHGAKYLAKLRYADQLQDSLTRMQTHVEDQVSNEAFDSVKAQQVVDELVKRNDSLMNPKSNPLSTALTSFGFVFHLGLSPASAMVNLSQTALVAYPIMGAKWGFDKTAAALAVAGKQAAANKNDISSALTPDERRAYDAAVNAGTIDVTNAHDLAGISQGEDARVSWKLRPVMKWASFMFHHAERFNRQITFVASYRLARAAGTSHDIAFEEATKATYDGHFDYAASNRPRIMQGPAVKVVTLFKQFGQNMIYTLVRQAQLAMKAETPEGRAEARKALGGLLVMHASAAGVLGLPLVGPLLAAASMLGGSDDEPWDAETALRNMLADTFGQKPAEVMTKGFSRLTPFDISGRVALDKLILPDIQEGLEGQRLGESAMAAALGPVAGIGINVLKGMQSISEGRYGLGIEAMMPAALRGPIKALRYAEEGAKDKSGIVIKDDVSAAGIAGQTLGFSPSEVRNATEGRSAIFAADKRLGERRKHLMDEFAQAYMKKDEAGVAAARDEVTQFNEKNSTRRINGMQLMQSVRGRQKRIDEAQQGIYLSRNRRDAMAAGQFAVEQ